MGWTNTRWTIGREAEAMNRWKHPLETSAGRECNRRMFLRGVRQ
jgi:hypothetical protein